jgi:hypothetical protein
LQGLLAGTVAASIGEVPLFVEVQGVPFGLWRKCLSITGSPWTSDHERLSCN